MALEQGSYTSIFPAGVTIAATWDRDLAFKHGYHLAEEFRGKGSQVILGPVAGPLGRSPMGGRNWEGFSPDPYLTGDLFTSTIEGIQDGGIQACAKHFIGNEQETQRQPSTDDNGDTIESVSSNIDDRTLHELYVWPFQQAVKAGVASVRFAISNTLTSQLTLNPGHVQLQQIEPDIWLRKQQDPEWNLENRTRLPRIRHV